MSIPDYARQLGFHNLVQKLDCRCLVKCFATPLDWSEVRPGLDIRSFTIRTVPSRLQSVGDPLVGILEDVPDLLAVLHRLQERL